MRHGDRLTQTKPGRTGDPTPYDCPVEKSDGGECIVAVVLDLDHDTLARSIGAHGDQVDVFRAKQHLHHTMRGFAKWDEPESSSSSVAVGVADKQFSFANKFGEPGIGRAPVELGRRRLLNHNTVTHDGDFITQDKRFVLIVRDEDGRDRQITEQLTNFTADVGPKIGVEAGEGFVEE